MDASKKPDQHGDDQIQDQSVTSPPPPPAAQPSTTGKGKDSRFQGTLQMATPNQFSNRSRRITPSNMTNDQSITPTQAGPFSPWSVGSESQLGNQSAASDISGDRIFPIRSVISVDPPSGRPGGDYFPSVTDSESRGIPIHRPGAHREALQELRRSSIGATPSERIPTTKSRRNHPSAGPMSRIQLDAARQGSASVPLPLDIATSDHETEDSGVLGDNTPMADALDVGHDDESVTSAGQSSNGTPHVTTRFTHTVTDEGYALITGRDGVLQRCEDEPIHAPGAVQGFGALVALREENDGCFVVRYVSENSERLLGLTPRQLFRLKNFLDILSEEQQDNLLDHIDFIRDEDADPALNGPEVFSISVRPPKKKSTKLWCAIHISPAHPDLVICEFELDDDEQFPLRPKDEMTPDTPNDTLQSNPTLEEIEESTEVLSKPLRILRSARKRRGNQGAMQVFDIMSQVQEQLASAPNLEAFLKILVGIVKELTGFHRVMIYQFDSNFNGRVVTELVDTTQTRDLYKGLNFPASDIPRQARDLYKLNKVRLLYDRSLDSARIVCRTKEDLEIPLDMSHSYLRAMSPIHLKYLSNMAVRSSMSISINAFDELWGLIACHSYGNQGMRVSFPIRKMCRLVGDTASRNIERLSFASRLQARKLINTAPTDKNPSGYIVASSDDLIRLFDADFGLLSIKGETKILGAIEQSQEALVMLEYLRMRSLTSVVASQDVKEDFPDLRYPPGFLVIAGLLYVPLSVGGSDFIVFFRKGQIKEVKWAGNPYEKVVREGTADYLEPRSSFRTWHETVVGKCRDWTEEQIETAAVLCLVYGTFQRQMIFYTLLIFPGKFIEVWRQKEAALHNNKLTRLLLANSAHEVRTPLNAIINYLEIALEGTLDQETRDNLARSHSASKSLICVINDLLDLTQTEEGQSLIKDDLFDLSKCIREATQPFQADARRKGIEYHVKEDPGVPRFVHGDERRVRQAITNVTANAIAHTHRGYVKIEYYVSEVKDGRAVVEIVFEDSGVGMSAGQLDALFRDLEQVSTEDDFNPTPTSPEMGEKPREMRTLGLGLAVVSRIVRNMHGQLRLKSEENQGSRFVVQLPFLLPAETLSPESEGPVADGSVGTQSTNPVASASATVKEAPEGEILLVDYHNGSKTASEDGQSVSGEKSKVPSIRASIEASISSRRSRSIASITSPKSDAERLIDALQTPLSLNDNEPELPALSPTRSRDGNRIQTSFGPPSSAGSALNPRSPSQKKQSSVSTHDEPGTSDIRDNKTPIRAVRIPDEYTDAPSRPQVGENSRVLFELPSEGQSAQRFSRPESVTSGGTHATESFQLRVLIAEDDPINMKILKKRLERTGHEVRHTVNGEECAIAYREKSTSFDVILMDMQVSLQQSDFPLQY